MKNIIIISTVTLALNLSACGEQKSYEQLIESAQLYSEKGQFSSAIIDYKNAVRLSPKSAIARLGLGRTYLQQGLYVSAEKELDKADELGVKFNETVLLQAQVKTRLNKYESMEELVKSSEELDDKSYVTVLTYAGITALENNKATKAQDYFSQASSFENGDFSTLSKAYLSYLDNNTPEALLTLKVLLSQNNGFSEALLLQGYLQLSNKNFEEASQAFEQYLSTYPQDPNVQFVYVDSLIKAGQYEQAKVLTDELLKYFNNSSLAYQFKSQINFQEKNYIEAKEYANKSIGLNENSYIAKAIAGASSYKLNELEQAYGYLIGLESLLPANHPINIMLLSIKIKLGHTDDIALSVDRLNALEASEVNASILEMASLDLIEQGQYSNAQSLLNKATEVTPDNAKIKMRHGALLLSQGNLSGIESIERALQIDPSQHEAEFALAQQYIRGNEINKAQIIATKWLEDKKFLVDGNILSGMIKVKQRNAKAAAMFFQRAIDSDNNNITALYSLASLYDLQKQVEGAIVGYQKVITLNPNHRIAIKRYSLLMLKQDRAPEAIEFLNTLYEQNQRKSGKAIENLVIGLAQVIVMSGQFEDGIKLLETIKTEKNLSERYWSALAETYLINKQPTHALSTYAQGVAFYPSSYPLRKNYISTLDKLQKYPQALKAAIRADKYFPNDEYLLSSIAYLAFANDDIEMAKKQLTLLKLKAISNLMVRTTKAKVAMLDKNYGVAINLYSEIYQTNESGFNVINLARALQFDKQSERAETLLEQHLTKNEKDNQVRLLLAELYSFNNVNGKKEDKIISTYKKAIDLQPNNVTALNNLAWKQYQLNELEAAQKNIEKAIVIEDTNSSLQETYGVILVARNQFDRGIIVLNKALQKRPLDITSKIALVEAYIATNKIQKAKDMLLGLSAHDNELNSRIQKLKQSIKGS